MRLASDSHVYEQLSEDIKSKSAILAALKAGLRPARNMVRRARGVMTPTRARRSTMPPAAPLGTNV